MSEPDDIALLRQYATGHSESAFATLVEKYLNLVYSTALRSTGHTQAAGEITQAVFIILARKADQLPRRVVLSGWLYQTTRLTAANFLRTEIRRQKREQEAYMQSLVNEREPEVWPQIAPLLDAAMERLGEKDRHAIVLRFFENRNLRDVGLALGASEDAAKMRVNRALEKLRKFFTKRGVTLSVVAIAGAVSTGSVQAAPSALAKSITAVAVAKGAAASGSTLTLAKGALKIMAWTKAKTAIFVGASLLVAAGTTTVTVKEIHKHQNENWQLGQMNAKFLIEPPYRTVILPTRSAERSRKDGSGGMVWMKDGRAFGINAAVGEMLRVAEVDYGAVSQSRTILNAEIPTNHYDFFSNLPTGSKDALRREIKKKFGVVGRFETIETKILFLKVRDASASGLKPSQSNNSSTSDGNGSITMMNSTTEALALELENHFKIPVINRTALANNFDFKIRWREYEGKAEGDDPDHPRLDSLKRALIDQLGLELVPGTAPVEMLVVEKAN